jgi:hypothetical protein
MPTLTKALFRGAASTSSTTLYTVPSSTTTIVTNIVVTNTTTSSTGAFTLLLDDVSIASTVTVGAGDSTVIDLKQVLATAKTIKGLASATSINFHISGVEIS